MIVLMTEQPPQNPPTQNTPPQNPTPIEIVLNREKNALTVAFDNGETFTLSAELLRVSSPSAEVQGHGVEEKKTPAGKRNVTIMEIKPVGNYAARLVFSDGHDSGLFSWNTLYRYGREQDTMMDEYIQRLAALGINRDDSSLV